MEGSSQSLRLLQFGVGLMLVAVLLGLGIQQFPAPRVALSAHLIGLMQGLLLVAAGLLWPRLALTGLRRAFAFGLLLYQALAAFGANVLAATWTAGGSIIPMATGAVRGTPTHEAIVAIGLRTSGGALIVALVLLLSGLRARPATDAR